MAEDWGRGWGSPGEPPWGGRPIMPLLWNMRLCKAISLSSPSSPAMRSGWYPLLGLAEGGGRHGGGGMEGGEGGRVGG